LIFRKKNSALIWRPSFWGDDNNGRDDFYNAFHPYPCCRNGNTIATRLHSRDMDWTYGRMDGG
jgi:hypothetical protein